MSSPADTFPRGHVGAATRQVFVFYDSHAIAFSDRFTMGSDAAKSKIVVSGAIDVQKNHQYAETTYVLSTRVVTVGQGPSMWNAPQQTSKTTKNEKDTKKAAPAMIRTCAGIA